jgi:hypothetical protein
MPPHLGAFGVSEMHWVAILKFKGNLYKFKVFFFTFSPKDTVFR